MNESSTSEIRSSFIKAMRNVANSVTVVTTDGPAGKHGATVSAFCSVSADPPTVLVCLNSNSHASEVVSENKIFCVNVLPVPAKNIADRFAGMHDQEITDRFDGINCIEREGKSPEITDSTSFHCTLETITKAGSHLVFIGHVIESVKGKDDPLVYHNGTYQGLVPKKKMAEDEHTSKIEDLIRAQS